MNTITVIRLFKEKAEGKTKAQYDFQNYERKQQIIPSRECSGIIFRNDSKDRYIFVNGTQIAPLSQFELLPQDSNSIIDQTFSITI